jgi:hypothetical protein
MLLGWETLALALGYRESWRKSRQMSQEIARPVQFNVHSFRDSSGGRVVISGDTFLLHSRPNDGEFTTYPVGIAVVYIPEPPVAPLLHIASGSSPLRSLVVYAIVSATYGRALGRFVRVRCKLLRQLQVLRPVENRSGHYASS